eukprot:3941576-Rhodomonas_salina.3
MFTAFNSWCVPSHVIALSSPRYRVCVCTLSRGVVTLSPHRVSATDNVFGNVMLITITCAQAREPRGAQEVQGRARQGIKP